MAITTRYGVTLTYEVGLASNPSTAIGSTSWTDLSAYVQGADTKLGRSSELDTFQAGTATFQLKNQDRRFDPNNASGPYTGNLKPMRRVRLRATYNAVTYPVWAGFVDGWPQEYRTYEKVADIPLRCTDGTAVLSRSPLPESVYAYEVSVDTPAVWWRLGDNIGTTARDSSGNGRDGSYIGGVQGASGLIEGSSDGAFSGSTGQYATSAIPSAALTFPYTIECWVNMVNEDRVIWQLGGHYDPVTNPPGGGVDGLVSSLDLEFAKSTNRLRVALLGVSGVSAISWLNDNTITQGVTYHVVVVVNNGTSAPTVYLNGVSSGITSGSGTIVEPYGNMFVGGLTGATTSSIVDEFAVYSGALSGARALAHYTAGTVPWTGDPTGTRIGRYLDRSSWPSADRALSTGISTLQLVNLGGSDALSLIRSAERSEQGQFYFDQSGVAVFRDRHWRFENAAAITSNATFGDGVGELDYVDLSPDDGYQFIANHVRVERNGSNPVDVTDATSIGLYYERLDSQAGLDNQSDADVVDIANWRLGTRKNPIQRITQLVIKPQRDPANLFPQVLGRNIGERITVKSRPPGGGTANTYTLLIEGIAHTITANEWTTTWYLSSQDSLPAVQPLILDDTTYGILDTNVLAY